VHDHLVKRLTELDAQEENLLDLVEDGRVIATKVRARLVAIGEGSPPRGKDELEAQGPLLPKAVGRRCEHAAAMIS
jgi:hypothetical protein